VTNTISFLPQMDEIILLENGRIVEMGTYDELKKQNNGAFVAFLNTSISDETAGNELIDENNATTKLKKLKYIKK
jgi:ABC-type multidrug transport system ATPase subunit